MSSFDVNEAVMLVNNLRRQFDSGKSKTYEWRVAQLEGMLRMIDEREKEIIEAINKDLSKPEFEAFIAEVGKCIITI